MHRSRPVLGKSRVVESRRELCRVRLHGKRVVARTIVRLRECLRCRRRWKTIEMIIPGSMKGFGNQQDNRYD